MNRLRAVVQVVVAYLGQNPARVHEIEELVRQADQALGKVGGWDEGSKGNAPVELVATGAIDGPVGDLAPTTGQVAELPGNSQGPTPAVPIEDSVGYDFIICLEDGKRLQSLKRYLAARYGMTPEQYRAKWGLPSSYPMVSVELGERRAALAKASGFGRYRVGRTAQGTGS